MTEILEKKIAEMQKQMDEQATKNAENSEKLQNALEAKADIVKSRDDLKKQLSEQKNDKATKDASSEELKKLLVESQKENDNLRNDFKNKSKLSQLEKAAKKAGFVTDESGNVNMKLLSSQIDVSDLHMDDDGTLYGAEKKLESLKKSDSYFFNRKSAPGQEPKIDPKNVKSEDLSDAALEGKSFKERVQIMQKRGTAHAKQNNGLPSGMDFKGAQNKDTQTEVSE